MWIYLLATLLIVFVFKGYRRRLRIDRIKNRHVFITGCDSGFGLALAKKLDMLGVNVYAGCLMEDSVKSLMEECSSKLKAVQVDVTKTDDVKRAAKFVENALNGKALWAIVNNAGICLNFAPFEWSVKEHFEKTFAVNVLGVVDVTQKFLPLIKRGKEGRIVNVTSMAGRIALLCGAYPMSKFAAEGFTDGLTFEMEPFNITAHAIEPSFFRTTMCDEELLKRRITDCWNELDETTKKSYGMKFFEEKISNTTAVAKQASTKFHLVTDAMVHALLAKHPQEKYVAGYDGKYLYWPMLFLPVWMQAKLMKILRKLGGVELPLPAEAVKTK